MEEEKESSSDKNEEHQKGKAEDNDERMVDMNEWWRRRNVM